jgi:DNA-binding NarL/FixJ family response regulator
VSTAIALRRALAAGSPPFAGLRALPAYRIRRRNLWSLGSMLDEATVIVADDHPMFRVALRLGVERIDPNVRIVEVGSLAALKEAVRRHPQTRLVLLDLMMPDVEGLSSLQYLRGEWPDVRVAVISSLQDRAWVRSAEALGAIAFIPKSTPVLQMQQILESVLTNGHWWPALAELPAMPEALSSLDDRFSSLSRQELRILLYIKEGRLNKQIADDLDIRESTVKTHITALLRKLNLRSRTQAAVLAQRLLAGA